MTMRDKTDWLMQAVLFTAGLVSAMQFAKIAPVMGDVQAAFGLSAVGAGFAVSVLGLVGLVFGVAAGSVVAAIGLRRGLLIALFGGALIAAFGAMAPYGPLFLATRLMEGFSHLLVVVAAPGADDRPCQPPRHAAGAGNLGAAFLASASGLSALLPRHWWRLAAGAFCWVCMPPVSGLRVWRCCWLSNAQATAR
ncbi:MAG: MFS transporter [Phyllobacteriaceae bacterium]|nr:MFS transporter [Phyllobacteriaceae bacterium]